MTDMIDTVFFSGRHGITTGATRTVVDMVARALNQNHTALIGMGVAGSEVSSMVASSIDLASEYRKVSFPVRALNKLRSFKLLKGSRDVAFANYLNAKLDVLSDGLSARHLNAMLRRGERPSMFIGLNSMSLTSGALAKKHGMTYVLLSQWMHPSAETPKLRREYESMGQESAPTSQARITRQLKEYELADIIWCPSEVARGALIEQGIDGKKVITVPFGVDLTRFTPPTKARDLEGRFKVLMVGRLIITKGVHILLEAVLRSQLRDADIVLNGLADAIMTDIISDYSARLKERGIEITFGAGDPRDNLQSASVFVLASVCESFGLTVPEAMASGLPVLVSSAVGACECVVEGKNGFVFPSGDIDALAGHLSQLYADRSLCQELGEGSREIAKRYDIQLRSQELIGLLRERTAQLRTG